MRRLASMVLGAVLAGVTVGDAEAVCARTGWVKNEKRLARFDGVEANEIVWGQEDADEECVGRMAPRYVTAYPERVEVLVLVRYSNGTWARSRELTQAWRESLPDGVDVVRLVWGRAKNPRHPMAKDGLVHQNVFYAGRAMGREEEVHEAITRRVRADYYDLGSDKEVGTLVRELGLDEAVFEQWRESALVAADAEEATSIVEKMHRAGKEAAGRGERGARFPIFLINGRYVVSGTFIGDPDKTYRIANRLIRLELEKGVPHSGPRNDEEFTQWIAPREGEVFPEVGVGRRNQSVDIVYSHGRRELWGLGEKGEVRWVGRLGGKGDGSYMELVKGRGKSKYSHVWRSAKQYAGGEGETRRWRYGAFLLTDYLSAPDTLWVSLPFKGRKAPFAFTPDGRVESRNEKGSIFGSWWLEAGRLNVSFGERRGQSWSWKEAAKHVGFELPGKSVTPWRSGERGASSRGLGEGK